MEGMRKGKKQLLSGYNILMKVKAYVREMCIFFSVLLSKSWFF